MAYAAPCLQNKRCCMQSVSYHFFGCSISQGCKQRESALVGVQSVSSLIVHIRICACFGRYPYVCHAEMNAILNNNNNSLRPCMQIIDPAFSLRFLTVHDGDKLFLYSICEYFRFGILHHTYCSVIE